MRIATMGELAATLAHELNQPLAAILSNAQAALRFLGDGEIDFLEFKAMLEDIVRDDKRAGHVIHNLRAMVSKRPADREACCLNEIAREMTELMHAELLSAQISLRLALAPALPRVHAARVELQQILVNLLVNAVQAMKGTPFQHRMIDLSTSSEDGRVTLKLRDRGHGILNEKPACVFEAFYSTKSAGLGMGLSICRRIIESYGGQITAQNEPDRGATFAFSLPLRA
jgi:C4-dicarboxylate-specific signal transduction histidine kinase